MRKRITLIGLILLGLAGAARAEDSFPAAPPPSAAPVVVAAAPAPDAVDEWRKRRIDLNLAFLPMSLGKYTVPVGPKDVTSSAAFAYGVSFAASVRVIAGLSVGVAPQVILDVKNKVNPNGVTFGTGREYDLLARIAYTQPLVETIAVYGEVLPGFSVITQPGSPAPKGPTVALGAGVIMGMGDRYFLNMGGGYQIGMETVKLAGANRDDHTHYVRVVLGGGVRF